MRVCENSGGLLHLNREQVGEWWVINILPSWLMTAESQRMKSLTSEKLDLSDSEYQYYYELCCRPQSSDDERRRACLAQGGEESCNRGLQHHDVASQNIAPQEFLFIGYHFPTSLGKCFGKRLLLTGRNWIFFERQTPMAPLAQRPLCLLRKEATLAVLCVQAVCREVVEQLR